jgi:hypothetical protein
LLASISPRALNPWQVSTGLSYRLGAPLSGPGREEPVPGRWEVGGQFTNATSNGAFETDLRNFPALGGFVSYRVAPAVYADAAVNGFLRKPRIRTPFDGGYLTQVLGGVKLGVRRDRFGLFYKTRLGVNSHSAAYRGRDTKGINLGRTNALAVDLGGVVERYVGQRLLVRFDGGDTIAVYRARSIAFDGDPVLQAAPAAAHNLEMTCGFGWRF